MQPVKRIFPLLSFLLVLAGILSACGGTGTGSSGSAPVTLRFMMWTNGPSDKAAWDQLAAAYHAQHPTITIQNEILDATTYEQVLKTRLSGGEGSDIFGVDNPEETASFVQGGYLTSLNDQSWFKALYPAAQKYHPVDGKSYIFPFMQSVNGVLYNKTLFTKYNLQVPTTYDQLLTVSQTLKARGVIPFAMSAKDNWWPQFILYNANAEHVYPQYPTFEDDVTAGKATFSANPGWLQSLQIYQQLIPYYTPDPLGVGESQDEALFLQGQAAMFPASWALGDVRKAGLDVGYMNFPTTNATPQQYLWGGYTFAMGINAHSSHTQEANDYIAWLFSGAQYHTLLAAWKQFPVKDGVDINDIDPLNSVMIAAWKGKTVVDAPNQHWNAGVQDAMLAGLQDLTAGNIQPTDVLKQMDAANQKALTHQ